MKKKKIKLFYQGSRKPKSTSTYKQPYRLWLFTHFFPPIPTQSPTPYNSHTNGLVQLKLDRQRKGQKFSINSPYLLPSIAFREKESGRKTFAFHSFTHHECCSSFYFSFLERRQLCCLNVVFHERKPRKSVSMIWEKDYGAEKSFLFFLPSLLLTLFSVHAMLKIG